jgi:hypothetical protein
MPKRVLLKDMPAGELPMGWVATNSEVKHGLVTRRGMSLGAKEALFDRHGGKDMAALYMRADEMLRVRMTPQGLASTELAKAHEDVLAKIQRATPAFLAAIVEKIVDELAGTPKPSAEFLSRLTSIDRDYIALAFLAARKPQKQFHVPCVGPQGDGCVDDRGEAVVLKGSYNRRDTIHVTVPEQGEYEAKDGRWLFTTKASTGVEVVAAVPTMADQSAAMASKKHAGTFGAVYVILERCVLSYGGKRYTGEQYRDDFDEEETLAIRRVFDVPGQLGVDLESKIPCKVCGTLATDMDDLVLGFFEGAGSTPSAIEPKPVL